MITEILTINTPAYPELLADVALSVIKHYPDATTLVSEKGITIAISSDELDSSTPKIMGNPDQPKGFYPPYISTPPDQATNF